MQSYQETQVRECLNVISFKGGGLRGVVSLVLLNALEKATGRKAFDLFDVFAGTSTGGIIAASLYIGIPTDIILESYIEMGRVVFQGKNRLPVFSPKYDQEPLRKVLTNFFDKYAPGIVTLEDAYKQAHKHFVVPFVEISPRGKARIWHLVVGSTFEKKNMQIGLVDLILSTTAAPVFFAPYEGRGIDPGLGLNNPSLLATAFMRGFFPGGVDIRLLSIGTGTANLDLEISQRGAFGIYGWLRPTNTGGTLLTRLVTDMTEQLTKGATKMFLGQENVCNVDVPLKKYIAMDKFEFVPELIKTTRTFIETSPLWNEYVNWYKDLCHKSVAV